MGLCRGSHEQAGLAGPAGPADRPQRRGEGSPEYGEVGQRYGQRLPAPLRVGGRYAAHASLFSSGGGGFVYSRCQKYTGSPPPRAGRTCQSRTAIYDRFQIKNLASCRLVAPSIPPPPPPPPPPRALSPQIRPRRPLRPCPKSPTRTW